MANNIPKPVGSRISIVDPNDFSGQNSFVGGTIPIEDLTISVQLSTTPKDRTVLTSTKEGGNKAVSTNKSVRINFIEGAEASVKGSPKFLTTSYTDLTTNLDPNVTQNSVNENLGITNIDIDFNSSYAPMITINFIDVRGGAIFQNGATSKYGVLFKLPYPLFQLTIKGYYGKPVTYCLHMTKVSTKFNSQTGNFEITANFIGYTYAMLTDMLLGFLKAVPYTKLGKEYFETLKQQDPTMLTITELLEKSGKIDELVSRVSATSKNAEQLNAMATLGALLSVINENVQTAIGTLINSNGEIYPKNDVSSNIVVKIASGSPQNARPQFTNQAGFSYENTIPVDQVITQYINDVSLSITNYNNNITGVNNLSINETDKTTLISPGNYAGVSINSLKLPLGILTIKKSNPNLTDQQAMTVLSRITNILNTIVTNPDQLVDIYDFTDQVAIITAKGNDISTQESDLTKAVATDLRNLVKSKDGLGFDPSIRNVIKIFAAHVEAFLYVVYQVATQTINNKARAAQFSRFSSVSLDNQNPTSQPTKTIYPWPEYNKDGVETYLGTQGVLLDPTKVPEVAFIEDLYVAMIREAEDENAILSALQKGVTSWYPINPMDTLLFEDTLISPYKRIPEKNVDANSNANGIDYVREILLRAVTYLGVTNKNLDPTTEINAMGKAEADSLISSYNDTASGTKILSFIAQQPIENFINSSGIINNQTKKVVADSTDDYQYTYITVIGSDGAYNVVPVISGYTGSYKPLTTETNIITNYNSNTTGQKINNGGTYIKLIEDSVYNSSARKMVDGPATSVTKLKFNNLKNFLENSNDLKEAGFNAFGGSYGIQEYSIVEWDKPALNTGDVLGARFLFYEDKNSSERPISNGLCYGRNYSGVDGAKTGTKSTFDIPQETNGTYVVPYSIVEGAIVGGGNGGAFSIAGTSMLKIGYDTWGNSQQSKPLHKNTGNNRLMANEYLNGANTTSPNKISYPYINFVVTNSDASGQHFPISLFGSRLYNAQTIEDSRALLFLHSIPWNGLCNFTTGVITPYEVINLFSNRAGFVQVPTLWTAFVGGLLWRRKYGISNGVDSITWKTSGGESLIPTFAGTDVVPTTNQYLSVNTFGVLSFYDKGGYVDLESHLTTLPDQVQETFINDFQSFVSGDWLEFKQNLEIFVNDGSNTWENLWGTVQNAIQVTNNIPKLSVNTMSQLFTNFDKYIVFTPLYEKNTLGVAVKDDFKYNYVLELRDSSSQDLVNAFVNKKKWIANTTYRIWGSNIINNAGLSTGVTSPVLVSKSDLTTYLNAFITEMKANSNSFKTDEQIKKTTQDAFGSNENNEIKLNLYRTVKAVYDKWIGDVDNTDNTGSGIIFQCSSNRSVNDKNLAKKRGVSSPSLIDSFRFVTRSFTDIGDDLLINPKIFSTLLTQNPNQSFYDLLSRLLNDNNFEFVALPTFINYNDPKELQSIFEPSPSISETNDGSGPSFVCVYLGQASTKLDFGTNSFYPNDSFDITEKTLPKDFTTPLNAYEDRLGAFVVNYGQQNQNIFKDIILDQNEFSETAESLQITEDLSKSLGETNRTLAGQNMYNVYSVRSYKAEVEMMGNAMIQPMMYFQLNNIPMFHGAYMITHVKHNIKPNYMTTHFTGQRIKSTAAPLVDSSTLFTSILGNYKPSISDGTNKVRSGSITKNGLTCALNSTAKNLYVGVNWDGSDNTLLDAWLTFIVNKNYAPSGDVNAIRTRINTLATKLNFNAYDLIKVFAIESCGGNPKAGLSKQECALNTQCAGLIQFCSFSNGGGGANLIGKSRDEILTTSLLGQLEFVDTYFSKTNSFISKVNATKANGTKVILPDLYLAVLSPAGITTSDLNQPIFVPGQQASVLYVGCSNLA